MDGWIAIPLTAAIAWFGYLIGRKNLPNAQEMQRIREIAGPCGECDSEDTEYFDLIDWSGSLRNRSLTRVRTGFCNACRHEWAIGTELRKAA